MTCFGSPNWYPAAFDAASLTAAQLTGRGGGTYTVRLPAPAAPTSVVLMQFLSANQYTCEALGVSAGVVFYGGHAMTPLASVVADPYQFGGTDNYKPGNAAQLLYTADVGSGEGVSDGWDGQNYRFQLVQYADGLHGRGDGNVGWAIQLIEIPHFGHLREGYFLEGSWVHSGVGQTMHFTSGESGDNAQGSAHPYANNQWFDTFNTAPPCNVYIAAIFTGSHLNYAAAADQAPNPASGLTGSFDYSGVTGDSLAKGFSGATWVDVGNYVSVDSGPYQWLRTSPIPDTLFGYSGDVVGMQTAIAIGPHPAEHPAIAATTASSAEWAVEAWGLGAVAGRVPVIINQHRAYGADEAP